MTTLSSSNLKNLLTFFFLGGWGEFGVLPKLCPLKKFMAYSQHIEIILEIFHFNWCSSFVWNSFITISVEFSSFPIIANLGGSVDVYHCNLVIWKLKDKI